jgi:hypothetical protein
MDYKKWNIVLLSLLIICLCVIIFLLFKVNSSSSREIDNTDKEESTVTQKVKEENNSIESTTIISTDKESSTTSDNKTNEETYSDKDKEVISEFTKLEESTTKILENTDKTESSKTAKGVFISIVDFLFYDGEINGITFEELTTAGKEKVLEIASSIDSKIESKFPGYKESISSTASSAYTKASEVIKNGAKNISDFSKDKLGDENYNSIIASKDELVEYTKFSFNIVKSASSTVYEKIKDKISSWYENFKNSD